MGLGAQLPMWPDGFCARPLPAWRVIRLAFASPTKDAPAEEKFASEERNIAVFNGPNFLPPEPELWRRVRDSRTAVRTRPGYCASSTPCWAPAACWATARRSTRPQWCCTARRTPWCARATDVRLPRPFPARDSLWSVWDTTFPTGVGADRRGLAGTSPAQRITFHRLAERESTAKIKARFRREFTSAVVFEPVSGVTRIGTRLHGFGTLLG